MADRALRLTGTGAARRGLALVCLCAMTSGCASLGQIDDPCAMANRDVSFSVLMENSISNVYNMCLERMRQDVITKWGEQ